MTKKIGCIALLSTGLFGALQMPSEVLAQTISTGYASDAWTTYIFKKVVEDNAEAIPTPTPTANPVVMGDSIREMVGNILALMDFGSEPELGATFNVTQEEIGALQDGDISRVYSEGTGAASDVALPSPAFDYVKEKLFAENGQWTPYEPLNEKIQKDGEAFDAKKTVEEMFFLDKKKYEKESDGKLTYTIDLNEKEKEILAVRNAYLTALGRGYGEMAVDVHEAMIENMDAVTEDIYANGSNGALAGADQTWKAINRALITDIAMHIQMMELDAAKFLTYQPVILMEKERQKTGSETSFDEDRAANKGGNE